MVSALLGAQTVNLAQWGVFVQSRATQEASHQRRWRRFVQNERVVGENIYVPLVLQAISDWKKKRIYLVLDTTVLWNQYCLISLAIVTGGRAVPFLWLALEHSSASVAWRQYQPLLEKARPYLQDFEEVMLLADRGFANQDLLGWLLWQEGTLKANLALASVPGAKQNWAIITDEPLSLEIFGQYGLRFRTEHLFGDSKSGVFQWESSGIRSAERLGCLYLVIAIAILFGTLTGMAVERGEMRRQVDAHLRLRRGLSYLKIGVRWLRAVVHQSKPWVFCQKLLNINPLPCFACRKAEERYYQALAFSLIRQFQASS